MPITITKRPRPVDPPEFIRCPICGAIDFACSFLKGA